MWYRHWIEVRFASIATLALWAVFVVGVDGPFGSLRWDVWYALPPTPLGPRLADTWLAHSIGPEAVLVWAEFAGRILPAILMAGLTLAGNAVRNSPHDPLGAAAVYTLTLPVSRARIVVTRFAAALAVGVVIGVAFLGFWIGVFAVRGIAVPLGPVAASFALGILAFGVFVAILTAIRSVFNFWIGIPLYLVLCLLSAAQVSYLVAAPVRGEVPWGVLAGYVVVTAMSLALAVRWTRRREY